MMLIIASKQSRGSHGLEVRADESLETFTVSEARARWTLNTQDGRRGACLGGGCTNSLNKQDMK